MKETEAGFQRAVIELAQLHGWVVHHTRKARAGRKGERWVTPVAADGAGFVDLVLARDKVIFAELKTDMGLLRPSQKMWRTALIAAGANYRLWRPRLWDAIEEELRNDATKAID